MPNRLQVVSPTLLLTKVSIQRGVSGCSSQVFAFLEGNVTAIGLSEELSQSKVNDKDGVLVLVVAANQKVVRFNIPVDDSLGVSLFDSANHLNGAVANSRQIKLLLAVLKETLQRLPKQVHYHDVELVGLTLLVGPDIVQLRYEGYNGHQLRRLLTLISEFVNQLRLPEKHHVLLITSCFLLHLQLATDYVALGPFGTYDFGGVHFTVLDLLQFVDLTEVTTAESFDNLKLLLQHFHALVEHLVVQHF